MSRAPGGTRSRARPERRTTHPDVFELDESKLHAPPQRPGIVARSTAVDRLLASPAAPVLAVVAPAGYGKTTLLAQWAERKGPCVAWLSADDRDNDPAVFFTHLAGALDRLEPVHPRVFRSLGASPVGIADVVRLVASIASMSGPVAIVVDDVDALTNRRCCDMVAELAVRLPVGSQLALASRREVPVPVPRLRAQGGIVEVGADDLAMDEQGARSVLQGAGVELAEANLRRLVERTEGWPAGLYLAALAIKAGSPPGDSALTFTGDERYIGDYLRSELLGRVSRDDVTFLTRTSILDRLTGPLCDITVGGRGSGRVLDRLERRNLLVIPLDRRGEWYRYHHLFRDLLHAELMRREPEMVPELHTRAAAWCEANNLPEAAIEHARQAGDADLVARLVLKVANPVWSSGRMDTVLGWMEWFATRGVIERHPAIAIHGALIYALLGRAGDAERWAEAAERSPPVGVLADGNTVEGSLAYLRALLCREGPDMMERDAQMALAGLSPASPYRPAMLHAEGMAHLLRSDADVADLFFTRALDEAKSAGVAPFIPVLLAQRGILALEHDDWHEAEKLATQVLGMMHDRHLDDYWSSAIVYGWVARIASHHGDVVAARDFVTRAARLRPLLTHVLPMVSVQALLELTRAYIALGDPGGARSTLRQINDIHHHRTELGVLQDHAEQLRFHVDALAGGILGASALSTAELRLVPLLPTHLSYAAMSQRLFVSRHTVKSQAMSIYRKLGVSSRGEAIARLHELGLVAHT